MRWVCQTPVLLVDVMKMLAELSNSFQQDKLCATDDPDHVRRVEASNGMYLQKVSGELF